jgi:hypothetical protein
MFPYSGVFPDLKEDVRAAFALGMKDVPFTILETFIQSGEQKQVEEGLNKLLFFDRVDLALGIVENGITLACLPIIQKYGTPVLINNVGACAPKASLSAPNLFYNSLHLWKSEWAMGKWSQETYGGVPSIGMSIYEAGYQMHDCFRLGAGSGGAESVTFNILKNMGGPIDTSPLLEYLEEQRPVHTHALLSGNEAIEFVRLFRDSPFSQSIILTAHPFVDASLTYAATWAPSLPGEANRAFCSQFSTPPHAFMLLAYECGLAVAAAVKSITGHVTRDTLRSALNDVRPVGPRGAIALSTQPLQARQAVYLFREGRFSGELPALHWDDPIILSTGDNLSGWVNPYLCV